MRCALSCLLLPVFLCVATARADLASNVRSILANPAIAKADVGVQIIRLGQLREQDQTLVSVHADDKFIPASNLKIITTAAALEALGPDFRFRTRFAINPARDVALIGDGDPTFGDSEYLADTGWTSTTVFENWASQLAKSGVTQVNDVVVDDSIFEDEFFQPNWPLDQAHLAYVSQVAGVNFNANCLDMRPFRTDAGGAGYRFEPTMKYATTTNQLTLGSKNSIYLSRVLGSNKIILKGTTTGASQSFRVTIDDPPRFAATTLAEVLERKGVHVAGKVRRDRTLRAAADAKDSPWKLVAVHETPLLPVMERTNKESINLYAESIGKRAAAEQSKKPGSWKLLGETQAAFMKTVGAPPDDYVFDDGCGLSKENAVAPAAFAATLAYMFHSDHREAYVATLAVGGVDGTLSKRYKTDKDTPIGLAGRVFAKSGSVNGVSTLSGYLKTRTGEWFAFSVLINKRSDLGTAQRVQDDIVRAIDASAE